MAGVDKETGMYFHTLEQFLAIKKESILWFVTG